MKVIALFSAAMFLLAVTEASAQSRGGTRCPNSGYRGSVWCCQVNSDWCLMRARRAAGWTSSTATAKDR
jgi:hypothetical protein